MTIATEPLTFIEISPKKTAIGSVIWLHGLGADGNDFVPIVSELQLPDDLPVRFIFPNAPKIPVTLNNGYIMPAWFDIMSLDKEQLIDFKGIDHSVHSIKKLIEKERERGIPSEKIILAGFSQGAVIALMTGINYSKRLGGIMALSGFLPGANEVLAKANPINASLPIFLAHGIQDSVVPFMAGEMTRNALMQHAYPVSWHPYSMAHTVCLEEIRDISAWLCATLG